MLRTRIPTTASSTINAYTTSRFPAPTSMPIACNPCYLQVDDDVTIAGGAEFVRYTGIAGNTFTGVTRGQSIGPAASLVTSTAQVYERSTIVYPVTTLKTAMTQGRSRWRNRTLTS